MLKARPPARRFDFTTRNRRPPRDPVNALLSSPTPCWPRTASRPLCTVGFDPYQGFYHAAATAGRRWPLDLMEEFRPVIADSVVLNLINNGMLTPRRLPDLAGRLPAHRRRPQEFFEAYEQRKATEVTHPVFGYKMTYGRMLEVQARMLAAHVRGDIPIRRLHYAEHLLRLCDN